MNAVESSYEDKAGRRIRTDDLLITNQLLYQLSYAGNNARTVAQLENRHKGTQSAAPEFQGLAFLRFRARCTTFLIPSRIGANAMSCC